MLDYIELTTLVIAIIGLGIIIIKALSKLIRATEKQTAQLEVFSSNCKERFSEIEDDIDDLVEYAKDHDKRIGRLEDWRAERK